MRSKFSSGVHFLRCTNLRYIRTDAALLGHLRSGDKTFYRRSHFDCVCNHMILSHVFHCLLQMQNSIFKFQFFLYEHAPFWTFLRQNVGFISTLTGFGSESQLTLPIEYSTNGSSQRGSSLLLQL
jgi:hypothetical protein